MKINLRQVGGIVNADDRLELDQGDMTVARRGESPRTKRLSATERARLEEAAHRLLSQPAPAAESPTELASDSMVTSVSISHGRQHRRFQVASGQDAPGELWDLVDAMSDAARPS